MPTISETVDSILSAPTWEERIARIRLVPQHHGTAEHAAIYAEVARVAYVPDLAPDFAFVHESDPFERRAFEEAYSAAAEATNWFLAVSPEQLAFVLERDPRTLLVFRNILGFTPQEFSYATQRAAADLGVKHLSKSKIESMERQGSRTTATQALVAAETINRAMDGRLFGEAPEGLKSKQNKPDTESGWASVREFASGGVPYALFLHQRHYGGAFRQLLDSTSSRRGDFIEDAVESLFDEHGIKHIRTGSHNQGDIEARFGLTVTPAPDFVVYDQNDTLRAILECKGANDGGTARDKALRFRKLQGESVRLNGVPLFAVLGGMGWARVNDTLGPVLRDTDGRAFTLSTLDEMLTVSPFRELSSIHHPSES